MKNQNQNKFIQTIFGIKSHIGKIEWRGEEEQNWIPPRTCHRKN